MKLYRTLFFITALLSVVGCSRLEPYTIGVSNSGELGVILLEFPVKNFTRKNLGPRNSSASKRYSQFKGTYHNLPSEIIIKWQLANLSNCDERQKNMAVLFTQ